MELGITAAVERCNDERLLAIIKRFGSHPTAFQALEDGLQHWVYCADGETEPRGVVAYVRSGRYRIVAGMPIVGRPDYSSLITAFLTDTQDAGARTLFFSADEVLQASLDGAPQCLDRDWLSIGLQPEWDPTRYHTDGPERRSLRAQIARAGRKGVGAEEVDAALLAASGTELRSQVDTVISAWLGSRRMGVMRFLVDLQPFHHASERRYWVAQRGGRVVAFLAAVPVYTRRGWFIEDMIRLPDAPNGTMELLIDRALRDLGAEGCRYATLGLSPLAGIDAGPGRHPWLRRTLSWCYAHLGGFYHFQGLYRFKARFHPDRWVPQYLVSVGGRISIFSFRAVLRAFSGVGFLRFGLATLRRMVRRLFYGIRRRYLAVVDTPRGSLIRSAGIAPRRGTRRAAGSHRTGA